SNNLKPKDICITFDDGWEDNYIFAFPILKQHNIKATFFIISGYIDSDETLPAWRKSLNQNKHRFMKSEQIQELIDYGMEIGCHTMSHKRLTQIEGESAEKEIINSKKFLEEKFRIKIDSFSYPYGDHSKSIIEITKKAGFKAACVVTHGREISFNNRDIFKIEREFISNDSIFKLKLKLSGIKKFIRKIF
nr:polysaccharide deacetylase family protein [bacterium]